MKELPGIEYVRQAAAILATGHRPSERRLCEAMRAFWSASLFYKSWPEELRRRADAVHPLLFKAGSLEETARAADDAYVAELGRLIRTCLDESGRHRG